MYLSRGKIQMYEIKANLISNFTDSNKIVIGTIDNDFGK